MYNALPHLRHKVVTNNHDAASMLKWAVFEMNRRYELLQANGARNLADFNRKVEEGKPLRHPSRPKTTLVTISAEPPDTPPEPPAEENYTDGVLPMIVIVIDELADLMMTVQAEVETPLAMLAQKARAIGIHLILATQRPSVNVITGLIKANFPSRIAFRVASKVDSRTILDQNGAEALLGNGDMLFLPPGKSEPMRLQGAYISTEDTEKVMEWYVARREARRAALQTPATEADILEVMRAQEGEGEGGAGDEAAGERDALFREAAEACIQNQGGSTSLLQRRLRIGYGRAARVIDQLHYAGILGPPDGSKPREVLVGFDQLDEYCKWGEGGEGTTCHPERSEGSLTGEIPRFARDDISSGTTDMTRLLRALTLLALLPASLPAQSDDAGRLVAALLGDTPMTSDLETLTDRIGGRPTGSEANQRAFEWALERFKEAGVQARKEPFQMPGLWLERSARATVKGRGVTFAARVAALPFSTAAREPGLTAPLVDAGHGAEADFAALGARTKGAFVLVETEELRDLDGLFREYMEAGHIERRAIAAGAAGLVYMSSRPGNTLARHNASLGWANRHPMMMMERDAAARALRLLRGGTALTLTAVLDVRSGPAYTAHNVIGEIRGSTRPDEIVIIGAHLDSWDLGTGALDNGANSAMVIDIARQIARLGIRARADDPVRAVERRGTEPQRLIRLHADPCGGDGQARDGLFLRHRDRADHRILHRRTRRHAAGAGSRARPGDVARAVHAGQRPHRRDRQLRLHDAGRAQPGGEPGVGELRAQLPRAERRIRPGRPPPAAAQRGHRRGHHLGLRDPRLLAPPADGGPGGLAGTEHGSGGPDEVVQRVRRVGSGETRAAALALRLTGCPAPVAQSPLHRPSPALPGGAPGPLPPPPRARAAPRLRARAHS